MNIGARRMSMIDDLNQERNVSEVLSKSYIHDHSKEHSRTIIEVGKKSLNEINNEDKYDDYDDIDFQGSLIDKKFETPRDRMLSK